MTTRHASDDDEALVSYVECWERPHFGLPRGRYERFVAFEMVYCGTGMRNNYHVRIDL